MLRQPNSRRTPDLTQRPIRAAGRRFPAFKTRAYSIETDSCSCCPLRPRSGGRGRGPASAGEVRWVMCLLKGSLSGASTTSPPRCSATGPFLSPASRRRGHHEHESADAHSLEDDEGASASTEHGLKFYPDKNGR